MSNRVDDIDEAIVSCCIALIKYYPPDSEARRQIWRVMINQFDLDVDADLINQLVECFSEATGRDIKGLSKLAARKVLSVQKSSAEFGCIQALLNISGHGSG